MSPKTAVVTGANSGIGKATAEQLALGGVRVILACRNAAKGEAAATTISGDVEVRELDLADLDSVRSFAARIDAPLDLLINNAGVMATPLTRTAQGFELQLATNHLGHFALTGLLLPRLLAAPAARVTNVSSGAHRIGRINFDDLQSVRKYGRWVAYGQSKLANLLFTSELQRRAAGTPLRATAAHPGWTSTPLGYHSETVADRVMWVGNKLFAQTAEAGARTTLYAATEDIPGGSFVGPSGLAELRGRPRIVGRSKRARDHRDAARLWEVSERLTGVSFNFGLRHSAPAPTRARP